MTNACFCAPYILAISVFYFQSLDDADRSFKIPGDQKKFIMNIA